MRLILLALITTTLLCALFCSIKLLPFHQKELNAKGSVDGVKISVIANILRNYTDNKDAVKTALRYHNETDDPELWTAMTIVESKCNRAAVSASGAQGKLQVMPCWKKMPGFEFYNRKDSHLDDTKNFRAAYKIYRRLLEKQNGNKWLAVERYCGAGAAAKAYVAKVRQLYSSIKSATDQAAQASGAGLYS